MRSAGPLLGARLGCGRPLARCRDHGFGIGADLFELAAQLLHCLFGRLAGGRALGRPLLGARFRCGRPLARCRDLGLGIGAQLLKLGTQLLQAPFVRLCRGRALGRSLNTLFGSLLLHRAEVCARRRRRA